MKIIHLMSSMRLALALLGMAAFAAAPPARALSLDYEPRYAAIVIDALDGSVLYERRADVSRQAASITKVMTVLLAFDALEAGTLRLSDWVEMTPTAARQPPSKLGLRAGERITVEQAIGIIAVKSANDVAVALAERLAGSEAAFVARMNARALELGMTRTRFANATGLPSAEHFTTARDLATLSLAVVTLHGPRYAFFSTQSLDWGGRLLPNHNRLLGRVPGVDGIKTGFTSASGYTLAASAVRDGRRIIAIVLGTPSGDLRNANVASLIEAGYAVIGARGRGQLLSIAALLGEPGEAIPSDAIGALIEQGSAAE